LRLRSGIGGSLASSEIRPSMATKVQMQGTTSSQQGQFESFIPGNFSSLPKVAGEEAHLR
jgi:hypothetical protein